MLNHKLTTTITNLKQRARDDQSYLNNIILNEHTRREKSQTMASYSFKIAIGIPDPKAWYQQVVHLNID